MASAFVLIATKYGKAEEVAYKLNRMQNIKNIEAVEGEYDLIAEIDAKNEIKLTNIMHENIRKLKNVALVSPLMVKNNML
ncbi:MAG: Lrp/AsnC ligand binding domain-containing protein [Nanoarchaeota archaeon]